MKYKLGKFYVEPSEDHYRGSTIIMKVRDNIKSSSVVTWDCHVLMWEVQPNEKWGIIEAMDKRMGKETLKDLTREQRKMAITSLLEHGIRDETR